MYKRAEEPQPRNSRKAETKHTEPTSSFKSKKQQQQILKTSSLKTQVGPKKSKNDPSHTGLILEPRHTDGGWQSRCRTNLTSFQNRELGPGVSVTKYWILIMYMYVFNYWYLLYSVCDHCGFHFTGFHFTVITVNFYWSFQITVITVIYLLQLMLIFEGVRIRY